jgi:hypothetical protein
MKQSGFSVRRWLAMGALAVVGLAGLFGLAEIAVRIFLPQEHLPPDLFVTDPNLGYRVARNYRGTHVTRDFTVPLATNSLGLRDREYGPPPPGGLRIYFLGDSFIFGNRVPLEQTVTKVLERALQQRLGPRPVEVVNGGMPGYSTIQELTFFDETVGLIRPDVVLLGMCVGNDMWDNLVYSTRNPGDSGGGGAWRGGGGGLRAKATLLLKHSDLYLLIRRTFNQTFRGAEVEDREADRPPSMIDPALRLTEDAVLGFAKATRARGMRFVVLLIPVTERVIPATTQRELNQRFMEFAKREGIDVVDLMPLFQAHAQDGLYYTVHWTPRGHALVAGAVADLLLHDGALGTPSAMAAKAE